MERREDVFEKYILFESLLFMLCLILSLLQDLLDDPHKAKFSSFEKTNTDLDCRFFFFFFLGGGGG